MIKGYRCDVRKALSKEEMRDSRFSGTSECYVPSVSGFYKNAVLLEFYCLTSSVVFM